MSDDEPASEDDADLPDVALELSLRGARVVGVCLDNQLGHMGDDEALELLQQELKEAGSPEALLIRTGAFAAIIINGLSQYLEAEPHVVLDVMRQCFIEGDPGGISRAFLRDPPPE